MIYILLLLFIFIIILAIIGNNNIIYEDFTISTVGNIRDKIKLYIRNNIISSVKKHKKNDKEIEDVQLLNENELINYLD